ncbi:MAG: HAMP domain-containing histidine kinase, partial [Clostridiales bacterium]|nr:HAMP domain-containing histidine kinase [Clostridiales bacterium]
LLLNHQKLLENEEARKKMMSNVSHDLRTPITAIRGYVELMMNAKEPLPREQELQYLSNMHTRSVQMEQLISDLVQLTRMESENDTIELMPISIKEMVGDLYQLYHAECEGSEKVISFHAPEDDDLLIDGDPKKLLRVFENIIVNAMKYTHDDGKIDITCHRYKDPAMLGGNAVEVIIKDNGVGIPENEVPYVFDRFYRAENSGINKTGSGLGLSIVKSVVDKHGGKIWVESEEGVGSEFHIVFKASQYSFEEEPEDEEEKRTARLSSSFYLDLNQLTDQSYSPRATFSAETSASQSRPCTAQASSMDSP